MKRFLSIPLVFLSAVMLFIILSACKKNMEQANTIPSTPVITMPPVTDTGSSTTPPAFPANGKTFLALGDSYTIGQSVMAEERFPYQTARMLASGGVPVNQPFIIATTGWTTGNLLNALNNNPPVNNYDIVTLLIGVNNQYQGRPLDEYKTEFMVLLNMAIHYAADNKTHVFVVSIPDYSVTPFAANSDTAQIAREIDEFNAAAKQITLATGIQFIDITPISRQGRTDASLQATDGLHPSGKQYKMWSELLVPAIKSSL